MSADGRLLAFGAVALVAAVGLVRRGGRALVAPWAHTDERKHYHIELGVYYWLPDHEVWENDVDFQEILSTTDSLQEAEQIIGIVKRFTEEALHEPKWEEERSWLEEGGPARRSVLWLSIWDAEDLEFVSQWQIEGRPAGQNEDAMRSLFQTIRDAWRRQRVSFRLFVKPKEGR